MVPCSGLYADISDDSLEQNMLEGATINLHFVTPSYIGFRVMTDLTDELTQKGLINLEQMVFSSPGRKKASHASFRKQYKNYKESYVRHLQFDPDEANLSMTAFKKMS